MGSGVEGRWPASAPVARSDISGGQVEVVDDDDEDEERTRTAVSTHKSSAHIRLRTPQFLLETSPSTWHSHSRSDPSPAEVAAADALYSRVDKSQKKRLKSFAASERSNSDSEPEPEPEPWLKRVECGQWMPSSRHYEEINVTSRPDAEDVGWQATSASQQTLLRNLVRRNFPKVLPDVARVQQKRANRLSLPAVGASTTADGCAACYGHISGRLPRPAPPPRVTSTLGRQPAPHPHSSQTATTTATDDDDGDEDDGTQLSRIVVRLKKNEPRITEEMAPDVVQTESCAPPRPPPLPVGGTLCPAARAVAAANATAGGERNGGPKKAKEVRSVTTSTTGIS